VRQSVSPSVDHAELYARASRNVRQELRTLATGATHLEMRRARPRKRPASEQRPAEVRPATARACDDPLRRTLERRPARAHDARAAQQAQGAAVPADVQLIPRLAAERTAPIRSDL